MAAIAWFSMLGHDDDANDEPLLRRTFRQWRQGTFTWLNIRRSAALLLIAWEAIIDGLDRPGIVVVVCSLLFGVEALDRLFGKGG